MKKFLTVLLVIAVMFTFSFGSAFADVTGLTPEQQTEYDKAIGTNGVTLNAKFEVAWGTIGDPWAFTATHPDGAPTDIYPISKQVIEGFKSDALKAVNDAIYKAAAEGKNQAALEALFDDEAKIRNMIADALGDKMAQAQFAIDYAKEIKKLDTVDVAAYAKKDELTAEIAKLKAEAAEIAEEVKSDATVWDCFFAALKVNNLISDDWNRGVNGEAIKEIVYTVEGQTIHTGVYEMKDTTKWKKVADSEADDAATAAQKAALKAEVAKNVAVYRKDTKPADEKLIAAYTEYYDVRIDNESIKKVTSILPVSSMARPGVEIVNNYNKVQSLVAFAEKYKAERDADGNLVRDAKTVDDIVAAAKIKAYTNATTPWDGTYDDDQGVSQGDAETAIIAATIESGAKGLAYVKENAKTRFANDADNTYYPAEQAKVDALVAEFNAKVDAATKTDDITKATTGLYDTYAAKLSKIGNTETVDNALSTQQAYKDAKTALNNYVTNYYNQTAAEGQRLDVAAIDDVLCAFYGENGARTNAELKTYGNTVLTLAEKLPTADAQAAAKKAAIDAINAIPAVVTLADEAAVQAAVDAADAYADLKGNQIGTYLTKLETAKSALGTLYTADLYKKVTAVNKTDKAAVKALLDEVNAVKDKADDGYININVTSMKTTLEKALEAIRETEKNAVIKAINAIPVNVTEADKAVVEAARKLYDAYVEEYTDYTCKTWGVEVAPALNCNATLDITNFRELALAEATLGLNDDPAAAVKALKITASSSAKKGSITVKWTVKGDTSKVAGYEIWKSTKHSSGYKKAFTTTKKSYKNTKSLKKGTRYYYKVRAYANIDGKKVTSDWSNKARRIAK